MRTASVIIRGMKPCTVPSDEDTRRGGRIYDRDEKRAMRILVRGGGDG
jgi:hypothetical protein